MMGVPTPKVGVYIKAAEIARARERIRTEAWAKREYDTILEEAERWASYPASWYRELIPPQGSLFAYGKTGCPIDGEPWPSFGGEGVADLSRPKVLQCPNTGTLIPFDDPTSPYYDPGEGVVIGGVRYYLRGVWNAYVSNTLLGWGGDTGAVHRLTYAYLLTGEEKYANTALTILDGFATVMPTTIGPRDFQRSETSVEGRLHWLTSIVHRAKMHLINLYDLLYNAPMMHEPSPTNPTNYGKAQGGFTIRENIEENMLKDYMFGEFDLRGGNLVSLHNHEADEFRAMLALGIVLEVPEWVKWGFDGALSFLDNTIDRDGLYYETSLGYGRFAQMVYLDLAELLYNYDKASYTNPDMPDKAQYPYGLNLYDHPKMKRFIVGFLQRVDAAGRLPAYGNASSPTTRIAPSGYVVTAVEWNQVERFHARTSSEEDRAVYAQWLRNASNGDIAAMRTGVWNLFHATEVAPGPHQEVVAATESDLLGLTGLALLRAGEGAERRAVLMRGGINMPHAHDDVLGLIIHAKGYELTGDIGYGTFGSPVHLGWGTRQIAHNLVVVNQGLKRNAGTHHVGPGGDLVAFYSAPGVSFVEMDAPRMFDPADGVRMYRRGVALIDVSETDSYVIDLFRVEGGSLHEYAFHTSATDLQLTGVSPEPLPGVWTLWGLTDPEATFNAPGRSWGERILAGEHIKDLGIESEKVATRFWTPAPGNGYGFIHDVKVAQTSEPFTATWRLNDEHDTRLSLSVLEPQGAAAIQAKGPDRLGTRQMGFLVVRREPEDGRSLFQAVIEPYVGPKRLIQESTALPVASDGELATALRVTLADGRRVDYIMSAADHTGTVAATDGELAVGLKGGWGLVRTCCGTPHEMHLVGGAKLHFGEWAVEMEAPAWKGTIEAIDYERNLLTVDASMPGHVLAGERLIIENPAYTHNSSYTVHQARVVGEKTVIDLGESSLALSRGVLERLVPDERLLLSRTPFPLGFQYNQSTGFFDGKVIVNERTGAEVTFGSMTSRKSIVLKEPVPAHAFSGDDPFVVYDARKGDSVKVLSRALVRINNDTIEVSANRSLWLTVPFGVGKAGIQVFNPSSGAWEPAVMKDNKAFVDLEAMGCTTVSLRVG